MSEHVAFLRNRALDVERFVRIGDDTTITMIPGDYTAAADYIEQLEERLRITNELLEAKQEPNNAE